MILPPSPGDGHRCGVADVHDAVPKDVLRACGCSDPISLEWEEFGLNSGQPGLGDRHDGHRSEILFCPRDGCDAEMLFSSDPGLLLADRDLVGASPDPREDRWGPAEGDPLEIMRGLDVPQIVR